MAYRFPPNIERMVQERMSAGGYNSEDELLADAMLALADVERRQSELKAEIGRRLARSADKLSQPLDRPRFKAEARRRGSRRAV
jgi:Arc/MetJ-type ribon-helix-helix transcriptional regulator